MLTVFKFAEDKTLYSGKTETHYIKKIITNDNIDIKER